MSAAFIIPSRHRPETQESSNPFCLSAVLSTARAISRAAVRSGVSHVWSSSALSTSASYWAARKRTCREESPAIQMTSSWSLLISISTLPQPTIPHEHRPMTTRRDESSARSGQGSLSKSSGSIPIRPSEKWPIKLSPSAVRHTSWSLVSGEGRTVIRSSTNSCAFIPFDSTGDLDTTRSAGAWCQRARLRKDASVPPIRRYQWEQTRESRLECWRYASL